MKEVVSIVIPTYNRSHLIGETISSIQKQTYQKWECLIIDDGSTDDTENVVKRYSDVDSRINYHKRPDSLSKGANSCRNYGFELTKGEFINWFDDDDVMLEDFLEKKINLFTNELNFLISTGYNWEEDDSKTLIEVPQTSKLYIDYIKWEVKVLTPSVLFRRSFLEGKELFNPLIKKAQEAEFFSRIFFQIPNSQYKIITHAGFLYRQHSNTKSEKNKVYNEGFKMSSYFFLIENFKRSQQIKSVDLQKLLYSKLIKLFFDAIKNQHNELSTTIIKNFFPLLSSFNKIKMYEMIYLGKLMQIFKISPHKLRTRWLNFKFNFK